MIPEWSNKYSIHNKHIDEQHKRLFDIAKQADNLIHKQASGDEIRAILIELFQYMKFHFADEEDYMQKIGYPDLPQHKEIHRDIIFRMTDLVQNIRFDFKQHLAMIVNEWLVVHIMQEDMKIEYWRQEQYGDEDGNGIELRSEIMGKVKEKIAKTKEEVQARVLTKEAKTIGYFYRCDCRPRFRVLEAVHNNIQNGQGYHCKKCNAQIKFVESKEI